MINIADLKREKLTGIDLPTAEVVWEGESAGDPCIVVQDKRGMFLRSPDGGPPPPYRPAGERTAAPHAPQAPQAQPIERRRVAGDRSLWDSPTAQPIQRRRIGGVS